MSSAIPKHWIPLPNRPKVIQLITTKEKYMDKFYTYNKDRFYLGLPYLIEFQTSGEVSVFSIFRMPLYCRVGNVFWLCGIPINKV